MYYKSAYDNGRCPLGIKLILRTFLYFTNNFVYLLSTLGMLLSTFYYQMFDGNGPAVLWSPRELCKQSDESLGQRLIPYCYQTGGKGKEPIFFGNKQ